MSRDVEANQPPKFRPIPSLNEKRYWDTIRALRIDMIDAFNLATIFFMFLTPELNALLVEKWRFVLFPAAPILANLAFVWQARATLSGTDRKGDLQIEPLIWLTLRFIGAVALTAAVVAGFSAVPSLALFPAKMFMLTLGMNALANKEAFTYKLGRANSSSNTPEQQQAGTTEAMDHAIWMSGLAISLIGVTTTMFLGIAACAPIGVAGGLLLVWGTARVHNRVKADWDKQQEAIAKDTAKASANLYDLGDRPNPTYQPRQVANQSTYGQTQSALGYTHAEHQHDHDDACDSNEEHDHGSPTPPPSPPPSSSSSSAPTQFRPNGSGVTNGRSYADVAASSSTPKP